MSGTGRDQYNPVAEEIPFDNSTNGFDADDVQTAIEETRASASPGFSFGRSGNISTGAWLLRPGGVPSNKAGVNFGLTDGSLDIISVGSEDLNTYDLEIYQHDGNEVNLTLITTVSVTASRKETLEQGVDFTIVNPVQKNKHIAVKLSSGSAKNIGVDLQLSGSVT